MRIPPAHVNTVISCPFGKQSSINEDTGSEDTDGDNRVENFNGKVIIEEIRNESMNDRIGISQSTSKTTSSSIHRYNRNRKAHLYGVVNSEGSINKRSFSQKQKIECHVQDVKSNASMDTMIENAENDCNWKVVAAPPHDDATMDGTNLKKTKNRCNRSKIINTNTSKKDFIVQNIDRDPDNDDKAEKSHSGCGDRVISLEVAVSNGYKIQPVSHHNLKSIFSTVNVVTPDPITADKSSIQNNDDTNEAHYAPFDGAHKTENRKHTLSTTSTTRSMSLKDIQSQKNLEFNHSPSSSSTMWTSKRNLSSYLATHKNNMIRSDPISSNVQAVLSVRHEASMNLSQRSSKRIRSPYFTNKNNNRDATLRPDLTLSSNKESYVMKFTVTTPTNRSLKRTQPNLHSNVQSQSMQTMSKRMTRNSNNIKRPDPTKSNASLTTPLDVDEPVVISSTRITRSSSRQIRPGITNRLSQSIKITSKKNNTNKILRPRHTPSNANVTTSTNSVSESNKSFTSRQSSSQRIQPNFRSNANAQPIPTTSLGNETINTENQNESNGNRTRCFDACWAGNLQQFLNSQSLDFNTQSNQTNRNKTDIKIHTLILGTHPSIASLSKKQYYAHPLNAFWWIAGDCLGFRRNEGISPTTKQPYAFTKHLYYQHNRNIIPYEQQLERLTNNGFAIWDLIQSCERKGSLDANIKNAKVNDIQGFCNAHPSIRRIVFSNGKTQCSLFAKHFKHWWNDGSHPDGSDVVTMLLPEHNEVSINAFGKTYGKRVYLDFPPMNGGTIKQEGPVRKIHCVCMLGVSPANARFSYEEKRDYWWKYCYEPGLKDNELLNGA